MTKRKTAIDRAIDRVDEKIANLTAEIKALELARAHLVEGQTSIRKAIEG